ncbi:hypothetical protein GWK91_07210 [Virgibacillus sp. MSP4-1]|uniref:competence type IV pilus minor pilin ComGG n=1 Tax=Virgibacillus sp. MSP4-1 TaxID=2700081 RepID=UPI0005C76E6C|nr:competence type IV pilus minor pilin ComGG [Virgibacillus sp. MSP4-1]QHS22749.1 hypothetical protein GWK91_07210 [Virgibacillus sp. MSP4-1]
MNGRFISFSPLKNERGYMFPYMLFLFMTLFLVTNHALQALTLEAKHVYNQEENIHLETLLLSAYTDFEGDLPSLQPTSEKQNLTYRYPDGQVQVTYFLSSSTERTAQFRVTTKDNSRLAQEIVLEINPESNE